MAKGDIKGALRKNGPMTLKELVKHTGLAPSTVSKQCQKMFNDRELSRRYQLGNRNIHFVYYFLGEKTQFSKKREELCPVSLLKQRSGR
jgi:DNA-binding transcriptional regulator GbsR (MarR family)